jgi:protein phosphatase
MPMLYAEQSRLGKMDCFGQTDRGRVRDNNEDQFLIADLRKSLQVHHTSLPAESHTWMHGSTQGQLLLVADGIGGHEGGEHASSLAVDSLADFSLNAMNWCFRLDHPDDEVVLAQWKAAFEQCETTVRAEGEANPRRHGMGTTLTMAYVIWPRAYVLHAGDSRCYLLRGGHLEQVTTDHTIAQKYLEAGLMNPEQAAHSRFSHVLWNAIGGNSHDFFPEAHRLELQIGDILLLCTDGLTNMVDDAGITRLIEPVGTAAEKCGRLVEAANRAGGKDNITVVAAQFLDTAGSLPQAEAIMAAEDPSSADFDYVLAEEADEGRESRV